MVFIFIIIIVDHFLNLYFNAFFIPSAIVFSIIYILLINFYVKLTYIVEKHFLVTKCYVYVTHIIFALIVFTDFSYRYCDFPNFDIDLV